MTSTLVAPDGTFDIFAASPLPTGLPHLDKRSWNALIGVTTAIIGNVLISVALNIQRYAHIRLRKEKEQRSQAFAQARKYSAYGTIPETNGNGNGRSSSDSYQASEAQPLREDARGLPRSDSGFSGRRVERYSDDEQTSYLRSPYWWVGILLMTVGEAGNFLAYGFAPASIVSPLGVVALISNCIIAPCFLHETYRKRDFLGVLVAIAGAVTIVMSAKSNEKKMGPHEIWEAISRWEFELYMSITAVAIVVLAWASPRYGQKTVLVDLGLVGLFGEYTALSTKAIASLLSDTLWRVITFPITYLLVFVLVGTALMQIRYINRALQRFPSTQVIPTQFVLFTLSVIIGSAVLYRDFESTTPDRIGKFIGGCALTFSGVYLITRGRSSADDAEGSEGSGERISLADEEALRDTPANGTPHRGMSIDSITKSNSSAGALLSRQGTQLSRQDTQTSGRSVSYFSRPGISVASAPDPASWNTDTENHPENSSRATAQQLTPQAALDRQRTYVQAGDLSSSLPDRSSSIYTYPEQEGRRPSLASKSMSRIFPNPIVTPLSSSLNGVVAESLRPSSSRRVPRRNEALPRSDSMPAETSPPGNSIVEEAGASEPLLPRTEALRTEAPRTEAPRTEAPRTEAPRTKVPRTEAPRTEVPRTEAPRTEVPRIESPRTEAPRTEAPRTEAPRTEVPRIEVPPEALASTPDRTRSKGLRDSLRSLLRTSKDRSRSRSRNARVGTQDLDGTV